jgi:hypothetical protein
MLIELWRKVLATDHEILLCGLCGNDNDRGVVFAVAKTDDGYEMGELCDVCLGYLARRKVDPDDPTLGNWPARGWPTLADLEEARRRYPEPMFADADAFQAACDYDPNKEDEFLQASVIWRMEPEKVRR